MAGNWVTLFVALQSIIVIRGECDVWISIDVHIRRRRSDSRRHLQHLLLCIALMTSSTNAELGKADVWHLRVSVAIIFFIFTVTLFDLLRCAATLALYFLTMNTEKCETSLNLHLRCCSDHIIFFENSIGVAMLLVFNDMNWDHFDTLTIWQSLTLDELHEFHHLSMWLNLCHVFLDGQLLAFEQSWLFALVNV